MIDTLTSIPASSFIGGSHVNPASSNYVFIYADIDQTLQEEAYLRGKKDGSKDKEMELIKMAKALFNQAVDKARFLTDELVKVADEHSIAVHSFYLKIENWDKIKSLIVVELGDYVDDKIDILYQAAFDLSDKINSEDFNWDYLITYQSDSLNKEKIASDGYTYLYEHTPPSRPSQP